MESPRAYSRQRQSAGNATAGRRCEFEAFDVVVKRSVVLQGDIEEALDYCEPAAISMLRRMENQFAKTSVSEAAVKEYEFLDNAYIQ